MRGKAGLAQTGGPKKTEHRDEFKESILQKKQGMVAPSASTRITSASSKTPDQTVPEAIVKKQGLTKYESLPRNASAESYNACEITRNLRRQKISQLHQGRHRRSPAQREL